MGIRRAVVPVVVACAVTASFLAGCAGRSDTISQGEKTERNRPGFAETRAIAEEGFIYGLPIVMNYAVMYEYVIDKNSGQYKAPFNTIHNEARVFTYEDTAIITPNSDTPYSLLWMDLRAEPMVLSVPAVTRSGLTDESSMIDRRIVHFSHYVPQSNSRLMRFPEG